MPYAKKNTQGIGLIEIIISVSVLTVGLLGLLQAFPRGIATEKGLEYATIASELAQARLEEYVSYAYADIATGTIEAQVPVSADTGSLLHKFLRTTEVSLVDQFLNVTETDIGLKRITVTIAWPSTTGGAARTTTVRTLVSNR